MTPSAALSREIPDLSAFPVGADGGWYRLRGPSGRVLVWASGDLPAIGLVTAWRSRQQAETGRFNGAIVLSAAEFAAAAVPVGIALDA
jgi:hypothetical protein